MHEYIDFSLAVHLHFHFSLRNNYKFACKNFFYRVHDLALKFNTNCFKRRRLADQKRSNQAFVQGTMFLFRDSSDGILFPGGCLMVQDQRRGIFVQKQGIHPGQRLRLPWDQGQGRRVL